MTTNSSAVTLSPATVSAIAEAVAVAVTMVLTGGQAPTLPQPSPKVSTQPKAGAKAKRSTKASSKTEPKVQRFVSSGSLQDVVLGDIPKGAIFQLRSEGAQYKKTSPKGSTTVKGLHPKGETYDFDGARTVFLVG